MSTVFTSLLHKVFNLNKSNSYKLVSLSRYLFKRILLWSKLLKRPWKSAKFPLQFKVVLSKGLSGPFHVAYFFLFLSYANQGINIINHSNKQLLLKDSSMIALYIVPSVSQISLPSLRHVMIGQNTSGAPNVKFRKISVRKTICRELEFSKHLF